VLAQRDDAEADGELGHVRVGTSRVGDGVAQRIGDEHGILVPGIRKHGDDPRVVELGDEVARSKGRGDDARDESARVAGVFGSMKSSDRFQSVDSDGDQRELLMLSPSLGYGELEESLEE
jgi:hypothetical protein